MIISSVGTDIIDPESRAAQDKARIEEDLNRFLTLLVTQLKHQDPLDSNEFTSQLVQFASIEQQILQNANLEKLLNLQESSQVGSMVDFLGTTVEVEGRKFPLRDGEAAFTYTLPSNAASSTITITNSSGLAVFITDAQTSAGKHAFTWDGKANNGQQQPDGTYTVLVSSLDPLNDLLSVEHTVFGQVTGAGVDDGEVTLFLGDVEVGMEKILTVKETAKTGV